MSTAIHGPGDGEVHVAGPIQIVIKATGDDTAGSFFLAESTIAPGFAGPPPHWHEHLHDMFYVLEGTLTLRVANNARTLEPGSFACVPPGTVHTFTNRSDAPVRFLNFNTPSGWEKYMRDLTEVARSELLTPQVIGRVASRYDFHLA